MMKVWVDADACPRSVLAILRRLQQEHAFALGTVASVNHCLEGAEHIMVDAADQATDLALINRVQAGDILVTQDWGLSAVILAKGWQVIDPNGRIFSDRTIDLLLAERHLKAKFRRCGGRTKGPSARTKANDEAFERAFRQLLASVLGEQRADR